MEGIHRCYKGPQGRLQRNFNHICVELCLLRKKKKRLWEDKWWRNRKEAAMVWTVLPCTDCNGGCKPGFCFKKRYVCPPPSLLSFRRMGLWLKSGNSWMRKMSAVLKSN